MKKFPLWGIIFLSMVLTFTACGGSDPDIPQPEPPVNPDPKPEPDP